MPVDVVVSEIEYEIVASNVVLKAYHMTANGGDVYYWVLKSCDRSNVEYSLEAS